MCALCILNQWTYVLFHRLVIETPSEVYILEMVHVNVFEYLKWEFEWIHLFVSSEKSYDPFIELLYFDERENCQIAK